MIQYPLFLFYPGKFRLYYLRLPTCLHLNSIEGLKLTLIQFQPSQFFHLNTNINPSQQFIPLKFTIFQRPFPIRNHNGLLPYHCFCAWFRLMDKIKVFLCRKNHSIKKQMYNLLKERNNAYFFHLEQSLFLLFLDLCFANFSILINHIYPRSNVNYFLKYFQMNS